MKLLREKIEIDITHPRRATIPQIAWRRSGGRREEELHLVLLRKTTLSLCASLLFPVPRLSSEMGLEHNCLYRKGGSVAEAPARLSGLIFSLPVCPRPVELTFTLPSDGSRDTPTFHLPLVKISGARQLTGKVDPVAQFH
jgi:hypothetical protein